MAQVSRALVLGIFWIFVACGEEDKRPPVPQGATYACESVDNPTPTFVKLGFLRGAPFWTCRPPSAGSGAYAITNVQGVRTAVTGGSIALNLEWTGGDSIAGHTIYLWKQNGRGYYAARVLSNENPIATELYIDRNASGGRRTFYLAVDDGSGTAKEPQVGALYSFDVDIIAVGSGDIQVSLNWDTPTDVDLHVVEPGGEEIYYGHKNSATGGELDLDSNAGCALDNKNNENIFWPSGAAPSG